ncbi:MAG TPA: hypothetical protein VNH11_17905 [Pirellulales bacterium]|nr:hypothetical protein [Pirellulales bacterium]
MSTPAEINHREVDRHGDELARICWIGLPDKLYFRLYGIRQVPVVSGRAEDGLGMS